MKIINLIIALFLIISVNAQKTTEVVIIHTNDMHGKIDNFSKLSLQVDSIRKMHKNVFLFNAGDNFTGNPIVDRYELRGLPIINLMNILKFDISCLGNHEFDYGQENFNKLAKIANFPFICANIKMNKNAIMKKRKPFKKFTTKDGTTIGVFSVIQVGKNGYPATNPIRLQGISFDEPIEVAKSFKTYKDSVDILIALTHLGIGTDKYLAKECPFIDVIIGGHSHTFTSSTHVGGVLIVQAGSYVRSYGLLNIKVSDHKIISKSDTIISLKNKKKDAKIDKIIQKYNNNPIFKEVIGKAKNTMKGYAQIGAFMNAAILDTIKYADIAFTENGGIRKEIINKGDITIKDILEISPFGNTFITYELKPKQIKEFIAYSYNIRENSRLQIRGIKVEFILNKNRKLKKVIIKDENGKKLKNKKYTIVINDYMSKAYVLDFLKKGHDTQIVDAGSMIDFIKKNKEIDFSKAKGVKITQMESLGVN